MLNISRKVDIFKQEIQIYFMLQLFKALSDSTRLRLVALLSSGELTVQELTRILRMGQSRISRHLKILTEAKVLSVKREGTWSYYRLAADNPLFVSFLPHLQERFDSLEGHLQDLQGLATVLEERRQKSLQFFDHHARQWDVMADALLPVASYADDLLNAVPTGARIVEVGVGTGRLLRDLARKGEGVLGVDHSAAMLAEARLRVENENFSGVELRLGEMTHLPLENEEVDCAVANMVLHHAAEPFAVLKEIARVLSPGGVLVVADLARHDQEWVRDRMADLWLGFEEAELKAWVERAGFACTRCERIGQGVKGQLDVFLLAARKL